MKLSIILPARYPGMNMHLLLRILRAVLTIPHEVLVVVESAQEASHLPLHESSDVVRVISQPGRGVVDAIQTGVAQAGGEYVLIFAADEVGPLLAVNDMLALAESGCDFVSCTRYAHGGRRLGGSPIVAFLSRQANRLFAQLSGCVLSDATTGIKLFRRELFPQFGLEARSVGWAVAFEMSIKAQLFGWQLGEVPIVSIDRLYGGVSTFRIETWTLEYLRWFIRGVRELRGSSAPPLQISIPTPASLLGLAAEAHITKDKETA